MHVLGQLNDMLEEQVEKIVKKGDISPTELDNAMKAVKTMNYIETIKAMQEYGEGGSNGMSNRGGSYRGNSYGNSNRGSYNSYNSYDSSYDGRRGRDGDSDGRYSEDGSYRRGRDSMGRYTSRDGYSRDEKEEMIAKLEKMMQSANSEMERQTIMECIRKIDN